MNSPIQNSAPTKIAASAETILVVEDHPCLCDVLATILRRCGYRVLTATNGEQAKSIAREARTIDLLLAAIEIPEMRYDELAGWFRPTQPDAKIVFMCNDRPTAGSAQPLDLLEKPYIYMSALIRKVHDLLNPNHAVDATALAA